MIRGFIWDIPILTFASVLLLGGPGVEVWDGASESSLSIFIDCLVLSREWGESNMGTIIGVYIGTTVGIHSPIPY